MRVQHFPPSQPSPLLMLPHPHLIFSLAYNHYTAVGPSSYASNSNAAYHPYARSALLTCLRHSLPSLPWWSACLTCLRCFLPSLRLYIACLTCL
ncbi:hypothetical protein O181_014406 [Austropuccinia psidii MF-1]|uniref:Uncharacterized protein n=1 Tax=Austropuccinia psidii MF-1 TaxID=1389203 RepID=A0A9Q3BY26_9BASI|nr:hypothetical protein [Austropuccinia psidii MF-1]